MYQTGTYVVYGAHGVCRVTGVEKQLVNRKQMEFLVLESTVQNEAKFFLPMHNPLALAKLHPVLTAQELEILLDGAVACDDCWVGEENQRKHRYRELIGSGERLSLFQMLASLYRYKDSQSAAGRKFHQCDENFMRDAENLLCSEVMLVMKMTREEAVTFLRRRLRQ